MKNYLRTLCIGLIALSTMLLWVVAFVLPFYLLAMRLWVPLGLSLIAWVVALGYAVGKELMEEEP